MVNLRSQTFFETLEAERVLSSILHAIRNVCLRNSKKSISEQNYLIDSSFVSFHTDPFQHRVFIAHALHGPCRGSLYESRSSRNNANNAKRRLPRHNVAFFANGKGSPLFDKWRAHSIVSTTPCSFPDDGPVSSVRFLKVDITFISRRPSYM